jgi:hypothetical protein
LSVSYKAEDLLANGQSTLIRPADRGPGGPTT